MATVIRYQATGFSPAYPVLQGVRDAAISMPALVRAAITVGRPNWPAVVQHGSYSVMEILYRAFMIRANLSVRTRNPLQPPASNNPEVFERSAAYDALD